MLRSSAKHRLACLGAAALAVTFGTTALGQVGFAGGRFVDVVEVTDHEDQADLVVQFNCRVRYVTHLPASQGQEVRIQLQPLPDCGVVPGTPIPGEVPPLSGGEGIVQAVRVDGDVPGQLTLVVDFKKQEKFVIAQGVGPRGLRMRLLDRKPVHGRVLLTQPAEADSSFSINLESQPKPFDPQAIQLAHSRLKAPVFVSEALVDGEKWYRLRVGPVERHAEAQRLLDLALPDYPRAWLAIGEDPVTGTGEASGEPPLPAVEKIGSDPALDPATLAALLERARAALSARDYPAAIRLLTQLQRQPEFPQRAQVQELLGLARERSGQLAHAKAEYEEYLRRYPQGEAAERVALRLRTLRAASARGQDAALAGNSNGGWHFTGGLAQLFRYDGTRVDNNAPAGNVPPGSTPIPTSIQTTTQDSLFSDVDLLARHHGESVDWLGRVSAGYSKSFDQDSIGNQRRISILSVEMVDRSLGLLARLGRQTRNQDGVLGTFDGLFVSWQWRPSWGINLTAGYPVEETSAGVMTARHFESLALAYAPVGAPWDLSVFATTQEYDGIRDRQAVGFETRYLVAGVSLVGVLDYDTSFHTLNTASVLGTVQLPALWMLSFDAEHRNSPVLSTRNALIGQPETSLAQLEQLFTLEQIFQWARDRTPVTSDYSLTLTRPLGQRFQFSTTVSAAQTGAMPASGGVPAQPATGTELVYQAQLYSSSLWTSGDFNVLTASYASTEIGKIADLSASSRFPIAGAWRIGPRLTLDHRDIIGDGSTELTFIPSILLDYQRERRLLQFEVGGQIGKRDAALQSQGTKRYYVSLAYRIGF